MSTTETGGSDPYPNGCRNRITATEQINGIQHTIVLEPDDCGRYREIDSYPVVPLEFAMGNYETPHQGAATPEPPDPSIFLG